MRRLLAVGLALVLAGGLELLGSAPAGASTYLHVVSMQPTNGARSVGGTAPIVLTFSAPLAATTPTPTLDPAVPGTWQVSGDELVFEPTGAYLPDGIERVTIPGGGAGIAGASGEELAGEVVYAFTIEAGSPRRAEELLAKLDYLPVSWRPTKRQPGTLATLERALFAAPAGTFSPIGQMPHQLAQLFRTGTSSIVFTNALEHFQSHEHLRASGVLDPATWAALSSASRSPKRATSPTGFTYAVANKALPETLTIWQGGRVVLDSLANTGIAESPTADGNFTVYLRLASQIMRGVAPWGTPYADPVEWIEYFHGSDAVHFLGRAGYGFPQSFGCVELPLVDAEQAWNYLQLNTLVSVIG